MPKDLAALCAVVFVACFASAVSAAPFATDTPGATPAGTTFTAPAGWTSRTAGEVLVLAPPESDLKLGLIDLDAKDSAAAVAAGWEAFHPGFKRPLRVTLPQAPYNGWQERHALDYETSPNEKLDVSAFAWRAGKSWLVIMLEGSLATVEKRGGPINLVIGSLRPKGYKRENLAGKKAHALDAARIAILRDFVARGMKAAQVPGVGLALIDGGKIVYEGGLGVRALGLPEPVDADTRFIAASNTKALTTLLLAELADRKKLRWDEPVTEAYPAFRLGDAATTREVEIKHLICACTGMPREDFEWIFKFEGNTAESALVQLGTMSPTSHFGEVFQYSNLMAAAAGYVGAGVAEPGKELGAAYDDAMQKMVLGPLGMTQSTFDFSRAMQGDWARPHDVDIDGKLEPGQMALNYAVVPVRPAGGLWTTPHDLAQYVMMELAKGELRDGKRLVSEENLLERRKPNVIVGEDLTYGMGLITDKRWGITVIHHGGDLAGYHSDMMWLPDYEVGAVILANSDTGYVLRGPFLRRLVEVLFDADPQAEDQIKAAVQQIEDDRKKTRERLVAPADAAVADGIAARYRNDALGTIAVTRSGKDLVFTIGKNEWQSVMASRKNDDGSISFFTISPNVQGFEFVVGERDGKRTLTTRDAQHEYVYEEAS